MKRLDLILIVAVFYMWNSMAHNKHILYTCDCFCAHLRLWLYGLRLFSHIHVCIRQYMQVYIENIQDRYPNTCIHLKVFIV